AEVVACPEIVMEGGRLDAKGGVIWFEECSGIDKINNAIMADMMSGESLVLGDAKLVNHQVFYVYTMELADGASLVNHGKIRIDTVMEESWRGNGLIEDENGIWNSAGEEIEALYPLYCEDEDFSYGGAAWDADTKTLTLDNCVVNGDIHLPQGDVTVKAIGESSVLSLITTLAPVTSITVTGDTLTAMAVHSNAIVVEEGATLYTSEVDVNHLTVNGYLDAEWIETETLERGAKGTLCFESLYGYFEVEEGELLPAVESLCRLNGADLNGAALDYYCYEEISMEYSIEMGPEGYGNRPCIAPAVPYTDVTEGLWFADTVAEVYSYGLMNGVSATAFAPDATASRAMFATVLWRMEGCPKVNISNPFTDVPANAYYKDAMLWAVDVGIINGYYDHTFKGDQNITREELAVMLHRYAEYKGMDLRFAADLAAFTDGDRVGSWSETAIEWNVEMGIIKGSGGKILPQGNATRAEMATMLQRVVHALRPSGFTLIL
ncbi:MAG: S-layer homology domain-containing protein, partial [Clostridia bacterium]|nr:S-layer homology domain-containing protein [Clostridia bacterium]